MHLCEPVSRAGCFSHHSGIIWRLLIALILLSAAPLLAGCRHNGPAIAAAAGATITLSSTSLQGGKVPPQFTCDGEDVSPELSWTGVPAATKSLALIVTDPDAPRGTFTHWVLFNLPGNNTGLSAGIPQQEHLAIGARQGRNDFGRIGYGGPCPPPGKPHRYVFTLYALDGTLELATGATRAQVEGAMEGHVAGKGELTATYGR